MSNDEPPRDPALSRAYRQGATGEPAAALDALILAAARKEAATPAPVMRSPWWRRALAPVGVFATIVVTVSVVLMIEQEQGDLLPASTPVPALAPAAPVPILREGARPMEEEIARAATPKQAERQPVLAKPGVSPAAAPQFLPPAQDAALGGIADNQLRERRAEPAPAASGAGATERKALSTERSAASPSPEVVIAPAPAPAAAPPAELHRDLKAAGRLEAVKAPAEWIEEIRRLRRAGQEAEAQAQLAAFRRVYPAYPLPDDLKGP